MIRPRLLVVLAGIVAVVGVAHAQQFEVASIRPNKLDSSGVEGRRINIETSPGNLTMRNVTLMSCIRWAYKVHDFQILGGPSWRDADRFDILAKPAAASTDDQLRLMLQALLADRFKLAIHRQSKETPVYVLTVGKNGSKLNRSKGEGERGVRPSGNGITLENATMSDLEQFLSGIPSIDRPVLDRTGLDGRFDFTLTLFDSQLDANPAAVKGAVANGGPILFMNALERIGLKLEAQKIAIDNLVIEHAEKPSEN
jgi:uncharacterized protein (TIGR03435 family)